MNLNSPLTGTEPSDAELVALGRNGDREAFGRIVGRYQSLICAIAYSACGNIAQSEDIAQEVLLCAWKQLNRLREPERLKSWLSGITRQTAVQFYRKDRREPAQSASELDAEAVAPELQPSEQAFRKDEESILWRALEHLDESLRETLVLYYREHRSIEHVAAALDLSEEAVRQRLSRGRKALQEQVVAMLEGTLSASAPGPAFRAAVMDALPATAIAGSAAASAAKGSVALKSGIAGTAGLGMLFANIAGPLIGMTAQLYAAETRTERRWVLRTWAFILTTTAGYMAVLFSLRYCEWHISSGQLTAILGAVTVLYVLSLWLFIWKANAKGWPGRAPHCGSLGLPSYEYRCRATLLGLPLIHIRSGPGPDGRRHPAKGWIAVGHTAYGVLLAGGVFALAPISFGVVAVGLIGFGGTAIGGYAFGGLALGGWVMGAGAVGYLASGAFAFGWLAAAGGAAWAHGFASGGYAVAAQANNHAARQIISQLFFFRHSRALFVIGALASWLPMIVVSGFRRWLRAKRVS